MFISDISIKRPVFATMMNVVLVVFGLFALAELPIDQMPNVDIPVVTVTVIYPGADPETVEQKIIDPLEDAVNGISGLEKLISNAYPNVAQIVLQFKLEKNTDQAVQDVRDKVFAAVGNLPIEAETPIIQKFDIGSFPIMNLAIKSSTLNYADLSDLAKETVVPAFERVNGVAAVTSAGIRPREVHIMLNRDQLISYGISAGDVARAVRAQNLDLPAGQIKGDNITWNIRLKGRVASAAAIAQLPLSSPTGQTLRIGDVALVEDTIAEETSAAYIGTEPTILLSIQKQSGSNTTSVAADVRNQVNKIAAAMPKGADLSIVTDDSIYIEGSINSVKLDLILGAFLATFIVFVFLRDRWTTLISAIALPTSVIATFAFIHYMGFSLNMMTTLGLSLAIGILIDDAIIVIENIHRHLMMGKSGFVAAKDATAEIGLAVLATTLTICAVFVPVAFMEGMVGRFFYQFGLTVAFAVLVSLFCAFTITPMLASRLLKSGHDKPTNRFWLKGWNFSENVLSTIDRQYRRLLVWALDNRGITVLGAVAILICSIIMLRFVPVSFFANEDRSRITVEYALSEGTSLDATRSATFQVVAALQEFPGVSRVVSSIGAGNDKKANKSMIDVLLVDIEKRDFSQRELVERMRQELTPVFAIDGAELKLSEQSFGGGGRGEPLQFIFQGNNWDNLVQFTDQVATFIRTEVAETIDVDTTKAKPTEELRVIVDQGRAADLGITAGQIGMALRSLFEGEKVGEIESDGRTFDVRVRMADKDRMDPNDLNGVFLRNNSGQSIQLNSIATIQTSIAPSVIERYDGQRQITVLANFTGKDLNRASNTIQQYVDKNLPADITVSASGQTELMRQSIANMLKALAIAVLLVYMVLCSQYESFMAPLVIMAALPLSLIGAFGSLLLTGQIMSIFTMIGIILLMGLVTKNGILLIDFTMQRMREGLPVKEALLDAGPIRLRPILMTTFAAGGGMVPVAIGHGLGGESRSPMGVAVIGGLLMSTLLTLVVVPCLFSLSEGLRHRLKRQDGSAKFSLSRSGLGARRSEIAGAESDLLG